MASLVLKAGSYYGIFSRGKKKKWIKIGRLNKKLATKLLRQLELENTKNRLNLNLPTNLTLYQYINKYLEYVKVNKALSTYKREIEVIKSIKYFFNDIDLIKIDTLAVENYKIYRKSKGLKPASVNKELSVLRFMFNKAHEWEYVDQIPKFKLLKLPKEPVRYLTVVELKNLLNNSSHWLKPIIIVLCNSGMRIGETLNLEFKDIDYDRKIIIVRSSKTNNYRVIPMNDELYYIVKWLKLNYINPFDQSVILRQPQQRNYLFCNPDGSKLKDIRTSFNNACKKADINATPHTLRHTFASHLIMNGVDIVTVKELLGHSSITTTMIYSHLSEEHKTSSIKKLPWSRN